MKFWLGLGSNLGNRMVALRAAVEQLGTLGVVERCSAVYESPSQGGPYGAPDFLNAAVLLESSLAPRELLARTLDIESVLGRRRGVEQWEPRIIDIDVLLIGERGEIVIDDAPHLIVPHPRLYERAFVIAPLLDLDATLPLLERPLIATLRALKAIKKWDEALEL